MMQRFLPKVTKAGETLCFSLCCSKGYWRLKSQRLFRVVSIEYFSQRKSELARPSRSPSPAAHFFLAPLGLNYLH